MTQWWRRIAGLRINLSGLFPAGQKPEPSGEQPIAPTLSRLAAWLRSRLGSDVELSALVVSDRRWKGPSYFDFRVIGLLIHAFFVLLFVPSPRTRRSEDLIRLTQGLALIVRANQPLPDGLERMQKDLPKRRLRRLFRVLQADLEKGVSLPDAMAARPRFFPADYVARVRAGYETGRLADALEALAQDLTFDHERNAYVGGKLLYVGVLCLFAALVVVFAMNYMAPTLVEIVEEYGGRITRPIEAARFVAGLGVAVLTAAMLGLALIRSRPFSAPGRFFRRALSHVFRFIPLVGPWLARQNLALASNVMARMLDADAPLDEALDAAVGAPLDPCYAAAFGRMAERVRNGRSLTEAADAEGAVLPQSYRGFVACGERSGRLGEALRRTAAFYRTRNDKVARIAWDVVLPCVVLLLGGCVFAIAYVVFGTNTTIIETML